MPATLMGAYPQSLCMPPSNTQLLSLNPLGWCTRWWVAG